mgnify:CR=1 FL=1
MTERAVIAGDTYILLTLQKGDYYPAGILREIGQITKREPFSRRYLDRLLKNMSEDGLVEKREQLKGRRRFYGITPEGRKHLMFDMDQIGLAFAYYQETIGE